MNAKRYSKQSKKIKGCAPTKLKTGYPSKFFKKNPKNKKLPTYSSTEVGYDTFLEQRLKEKCKQILSFALTWQLKISILLSLKDQHKTVTLRPVCKCQI